MLYNDDERTNTCLTPAGGREVRYTYDRSHQLVCTGYQDGTTQERAYDIWENIVWEKDRNGNVTRHTYDAYGHLLEEERSDGLVILICMTQQETAVICGIMAAQRFIIDMITKETL